MTQNATVALGDVPLVGAGDERDGERRVQSTDRRLETERVR
ncbi:hypothetical protein ACFQMM_11480 [Saliphagus sp. GCM10025308]